MIECVTSLADLEFKAKTDEKYQQLAISAAARFNAYFANYEEAITLLTKISVEYNPNCCDTVIMEVNRARSAAEKELENKRRLANPELTQKDVNDSFKKTAKCSFAYSYKDYWNDDLSYQKWSYKNSLASYWDDVT